MAAISAANRKVIAVAEWIAGLNVEVCYITDFQIKCYNSCNYH